MCGTPAVVHGLKGFCVRNQTQSWLLARRQGIDSVGDIECARLEVGGALTFVLKHPSSDEFWRKDAMERLKRIEEMLSERR